MKKILSIFPLFLLTVTTFAQTNEGRFLEKLDSIVSDNGDITRFTYDEKFRIVTKNTFKSKKLVRREISEYEEDGALSAYCAYEDRESQLIPVRKKVRAVKDKSVELSDSVYEESLKKLVVNTSEILTYDKNNNLVSLCKKMYDPKSDGKSYNLHEIYYDAEGNITGETIEGPEYKYTKEYKDGRLYVLTKYENRDGLWVILESTVREYYESGALKNEYTYDYSGIIFYMKDYVLYDENGEKVKSQENQQAYSYKYIRDEKGRVKEEKKFIADSETLVEREEYHYDKLPIDSAYYTLCYTSGDVAPYAKYYYVPNSIVDGKVEGEYSVYEKVSADGSWISLNANGTYFSHSYADKVVQARYEVGDESITLYDYTVVMPMDYGKLIRREDRRSMDKSLSIASEEEIHYDKSLSGSLVAGLEDDYKVTYVLSRDAKGDEVKNTYYYTSLVETTSIANTYYPSSNNQSSVYNLQGQKILCPQKGINIKNGRKIIFNR